MPSNEAVRFGRMYYRQISGDGRTFGFPFGNNYTLAFSRLLYPQEILVAYNISGQMRSDSVIVDGVLHPNGSHMTFLYGPAGKAIKRAGPGPRASRPHGRPRRPGSRVRAQSELATTRCRC